MKTEIKAFGRTNMDATIAAQAAAIACAEGIHQQMTAELAALRSQLEEQRKRLEHATEFQYEGGIVIRRCPEHEPNPWRAFTLDYHEPAPYLFATLEEAIEGCIAANWLTHAEKDGGE